jgi:hypothetical protein
MIEPEDIILKPLAMCLRFLLWLGWDLLIQTIGWSIGWSFFRIITIGHFPTQAINELENTNQYLATFIELTGLGILAIGSYSLYAHLGLEWHM